MHIKNIYNAYKVTSKLLKDTPLEYCERLSNIYQNNIYLKREDLQLTRSFKIRGAYNKISNLVNKSDIRNVITASAGNHAQGVAYVCNKLNLSGTIVLPLKTTTQKINRIKYLGKDNIKIELYGKTVDDSLEKATELSNKDNIFIPPFDDECVISGQGTIAHEIYKEINPDMIFVPIGGGGLISGISLYSKCTNKNCKIIGTEPENCQSMKNSLLKDKVIKLENISNFVDGASVSRVGNINFDITKKYVDDIISINDGLLCNDILSLYQNEGIIVEPAGALSISGLKYLYKHNIKNKNIVCIISGGNNDVSRYNDFIEKNLNYLGLKHYFIIDFSQKSGELKTFVNKILNETDDIVRFEYIKKTNNNYGKVLVGIEIINKKDINNIIFKLNKYNYTFEKLNISNPIYNYLI
uniref:threonine ammonia-lyase n=1 Tax=Megaviridae environmental sample TaxID=1737588 RepID=A0A5J6VKH1_9VIRU|nr:MAG: pyridoxal-phosphate dependent enzyme [Megaviridae environmental sample]